MNSNIEKYEEIIHIEVKNNISNKNILQIDNKYFQEIWSIIHIRKKPYIKKNGNINWFEFQFETDETICFPVHIIWREKNFMSYSKLEELDKKYIIRMQMSY